MALTLIEQVRLLTQDNTPGLYIVSDDEITFFLERNSNNVNRTALDTARVILLNLSMRSDSVVDILSIKSSKAAESYRLALMMFLKDPNLNSVLNNCQGWAGGVSLTEMQANVDNTDNNIVTTPDTTVYTQISSSADYFKV